jgi:hypothetical protein
MRVAFSTEWENKVVNAMPDKAKERKSATPSKPFKDLTRWERDMDRMMDDFFGRRTRA